MNFFREISTRGTEDCPFSYYNLIGKSDGQIMAHMHWHPEFEIIYMHSGSIILQLENQEFHIVKDDIVFINPNMLHKLAVFGNHCNYTAFVFSLNLLTMHPAHFFTRNLINPIKQGELTFPLKICQGNEKHLSIKSLLDDIIYTNYKDNRYKFTVLNSIFNIFLQMSPYCITNIQKNELKIKRNEIMKTCINYLENNINQKITLKLIADNVHLHPNYLCRTFKDYTGQTVFQYLTNLKINKACQLLLTTSMPISQIATECGFESISFFTKKFKELTNTTPKAYAKNKNN